MSISVGDIIDGKVTGVTKFGAFVELTSGESGLVHISEVSEEYVEKVEDFINKGDKVRVKVLSISNGKIGLSIKAAAPKIKKPKEIEWDKGNDENDDLSFEDKMSKFLKDSNERYVEIRTRDNKRNSTGRRSKSKNY